MSLEKKNCVELMCMIFGVGLVLYKTDPYKPDFRISVRVQKHETDETDMTYATTSLIDSSNLIKNCAGTRSETRHSQAGVYTNKKPYELGQQIRCSAVSYLFIHPRH